MLLRLVLVYFTTIYTVHSFLFSSPGWCTALLFWFYVSKCIKHYPIPILHNWQRLPNPYEDPLTLLTPYPRTPPPFLFQILSNTTQTCSFCSLISLAECVIMPHLTYYLLNDNMDLNSVEPWYLSTSSSLLCVLFIKASNLLKIWHE